MKIIGKKYPKVNCTLCGFEYTSNESSLNGL